jgi:ethanolamine-phosphate cytidylyltransferase
MHPGIIEKFRLAKEQGDYLYVGLWDDQTIRYYKGDRYPLQGLQERTLMALAFKYVDDVVIGAPYIINEDLIKSLNIDKVVHVLTEEDKIKPEFVHVDPFLEAKNQGIYVELPPIENDLTLEKIALRVAKNRA